MIARIAGTVILSAIVFVVVIFGSVTYHMAHSDHPDSSDGSATLTSPSVSRTRNLGSDCV